MTAGDPADYHPLTVEEMTMRKHRFVALLAGCMIVAAGAAAQTEAKKDLRFAEVDKIFAEWDKPDTPGCAVGVIEKGKLIYAKGYGMANLDYNIPMTPRSVVYIASTSKQFTAACVALLILGGEVSLEDDIRKYFPEIPDYGNTVKVKNLIYHTSGIRDYLGLMSLAGLRFEDYFDNDTAVEWIARQKALNFTPGQEFNYSNSGYVLLAELVKRASGKTLREFAAERLFGPLGMTDSHFNDDRSLVVKNRVISYRPLEDEAESVEKKEADKRGEKKEKKEVKDYRQLLKNFDAVGDGNLLTTVEDLFKWDQNFYDQKVGGDKFIDLILTRGKLNDGKELDYAFGLFHGEYKGLKTVGHGGGMLGFRTEMLRFPEQRFTVICLSNLATFDPGGECRKVADIFLADKLKAEAQTGDKAGQDAAPVPVARAVLDSYAGKYRLDAGPVVAITREEEGLFAEVPGQPKFGLKALSETEFFEGTTGLKLSFSKDEKSGVFRILVRAGGTEYAGEKLTIKSPSVEQLKEYAGTYSSVELDATYALFLEGGKLMVRVKKNPPSILEMTDKDAFSASEFKLAFNRNPSRQISGFTLDAGRVKNLVFEKK